MTHAVDFVIATMRKLSSSEPVFFERDRMLYVASAQGFGQLSYRALNTTSSEDAFRKDLIDDYEYGEHLALKNSEIPYFKLIVHGHNTASFTLGEMLTTAQALSALPDDQRIRIVSYGSSDHNFVQTARVMNREDYLASVRAKEEMVLTSLRHRGNCVQGDREFMRDFYRGQPLLDGMIVTPYIKVSLPRVGTFEREGLDAWVDRTIMNINYDLVDTRQESPFTVHLSLNARRLHGTTVQDLQSAGDDIVGKITQQMEAVTSSLSLAQPFLDKMNAVHNSVFADNIVDRKE